MVKTIHEIARDITLTLSYKLKAQCIYILRYNAIISKNVAKLPAFIYIYKGTAVQKLRKAILFSRLHLGNIFIVLST